MATSGPAAVEREGGHHTDFGILHTIGLNMLKALKNSGRFGLIR